eukprot:UN30314
MEMAGSLTKYTGKVKVKNFAKTTDRGDADLAVLVFDKTDGPKLCGVAYTIPRDATDPKQFKSARAYAMVQLGCLNGYYTLAHEVGHLFGLRHTANTNHCTVDAGCGTIIECKNRVLLCLIRPTVLQ